MKNAFLAAASFGLAVNAHMFIMTPTPIVGSAPKDPLESSGANFPCHGVSLPGSGGQAMTVGEPQTLAWNLGGGANTAVHGGGSCQLSLTYETDATAIKDPKNWHVIYSIIGGCPTNSHLNLDGQYTGPSGPYSGALACSDPKSNGVDCVNAFTYTIPKEAKNGQATLAWTWYNVIGNREIYMNCAAVDISGGSDSDTGLDSLPTLFVANLASVDTCPTVEQENVLFPYPGQYVTTKLPSGEAAKTAATYPNVQPTGGSCATDGAPASGASGASAPASSPAQATSTPAYIAPTPSAAASNAVPSNAVPSNAAPSNAAPPNAAPPNAAPPNAAPPDATPSDAAPDATPDAAPSNAAPSNAVPSNAAPQAGSDAPITITTMSTVIGSSPSSAADQPSAAPIAPVASPAAPAPSGGSPPSTNSSSSGACSGGAVSCPSPGTVVCIGSNQWGLCDINMCAVPQALASGTSCSGGVIAKRSFRHARRHLGAHRRSS